MGKVTLPEADALEAGKSLSEEQVKAIDEFKNESWDKPAEKEKESAQPDKKEEVEAEPEKETEREETTEDEESPQQLEEAKKADEGKVAEEAEAKRVEDKAKQLNKTAEEVKKLEADEKAESERVEKIAKEENKTVEEVKADELKDKAVAERHGNDAIKLARVVRKEQSEYDKIKKEHESLSKFKEAVEQQQLKFNETSFNQATEKDRDDIVAKYREKFPNEAENLSDDACFERGRVIIKEFLKNREESASSKIKSDATSRRSELLKGISDEYKEYAPEVKALLDECSDQQVIDKTFDVSYLAQYARGKKMTAEYVKSLEDAAYKRGVEKAKIIPKVPPSKPGSGSKSAGGASMSDKDKKRAEEVYSRRIENGSLTREKAWDEYFKNDKEKDSKW